MLQWIPIETGKRGREVPENGDPGYSFYSIHMYIYIQFMRCMYCVYIYIYIARTHVKSRILMNHQMACGFGFGGLWILMSVDQGFENINRFLSKLVRKYTTCCSSRNSKLLEISLDSLGQIRKRKMDQETKKLWKNCIVPKKVSVYSFKHLIHLDTANALGDLESSIQAT